MDEQLVETPAWFLDAIRAPKVSRYVNVEGAVIHYQAWNEGDWDKPALLFVHGFCAHAKWWDFIAPAFLNTHRVYAMDLSGMGDSESRIHYVHEVWSKDIVEVARAVGNGQKVAVAGHSFGGSRSTEAVAQHPELFSQLVILDSYFYLAEGEESRRKRNVPPKGGERIYDTFEIAYSRFRFTPDQSTLPFIYEYIGRNSIRQRGDQWGWKFDNEILGFTHHDLDHLTSLKSVQVPVSLIHAEHSTVASHSLVQRIADTVPQCKAKIMISGAQHHIMCDKPLELIEALKSVL